jgi:hypothetical protein
MKLTYLFVAVLAALCTMALAGDGSFFAKLFASS